MYFSRVLISGRISNFYIKEFRTGRVTIKLSIDAELKRNENRKKHLVPAEIDVIIENPKIIDRVKSQLATGLDVIIEGRVKLMFITVSEQMSRKSQYIAVENIIFANDETNVSETRTAEAEEAI